MLALGEFLNEKGNWVDDTHLHDKYEGVLMSVIAHDTKNHVYPISFCVVDKDNDAYWTFFFENLKDILAKFMFYF